MTHQEQIEKLNNEIKEIEELLKAISIYDDIPPVLLRMIHEKALHLAEEALHLGNKKTFHSEPSSPSETVLTDVSSVDAVPICESFIDENSIDKRLESSRMQHKIVSDEDSNELSDLSERESQSLNLEISEPQSEKVETAFMIKENTSIQSTIHKEPAKTVSLDLNNGQRPDIRRLMTLNDRFLYMRELFHGDAECMNQTLDALNQQHSLEESIAFVHNRFHWDKDLPGAKLFADMLERQYKDTLI